MRCIAIVNGCCYLGYACNILIESNRMIYATLESLVEMIVMVGTYVLTNRNMYNEIAFWVLEKVVCTQ